MRISRLYKLGSVTMVMGSLALTSACNKAGNSTSSSGMPASPITNADVPMTIADFNKAETVCQPMSSPGDGGYTSIFANDQSGLQGRLYAMSQANYGKYHNVADAITYGVDTGMNVFLDSLNIPTRLFSAGFPAADGSLLSFEGTTLMEYFALFMESQIQLTSADREGSYQLALLSDDGAILSIKAAGNDSFTPFINNDGDHPTTMACGTKPLTLNYYDRVPMQVQYYQGPRYHIALQLMWRPVPADGKLDPMCGQSGNGTFFDYNQVPSAPTQAYLDMESRGWKPLNVGNYVIPGTNRINPCQNTLFN